jgi:hypothetical protein
METTNPHAVKFEEKSFDVSINLCCWYGERSTIGVVHQSHKDLFEAQLIMVLLFFYRLEL